MNFFTNLILVGLETQTSAARVRLCVAYRDFRGDGACDNVLSGPLAGRRRYFQGRKAQKRRACLTGRFLAPGCRG